MMQRNRIVWVDNLKLFSIFLVVYGHSIFEFCRTSNVLSDLIYSFHMPLFMTLSGFVSSKIMNGIFSIKKKFISFILPCISFGLIYWICGIHSHNFWFLKCLFVCQLCYYLVFRIYSLIKPNVCRVLFVYVVVTLVFASFPFIRYLPDNMKLDYMIPFFGIGLILKTKFDIIRDNLLMITIGSLIGFITLFYFWSPEFLYANSPSNWLNAKLLLTRGIFEWDWHSLYCYLYRLSIGCVGTLLMVTLFVNLDNLFSTNRFWLSTAKYGTMTLEVYMLQHFVVQDNIFKIDISGLNEVLEIPLCLAIAIICTIICLIIAKLIRYNKYINFILFGKTFTN